MIAEEQELKLANKMYRLASFLKSVQKQEGLVFLDKHYKKRPKACFGQDPPFSVYIFYTDYTASVN